MLFVRMAREKDSETDAEAILMLEGPRIQSLSDLRTAQRL